MSHHASLPGVLASLAPVLNQYGYLAVGGFVTLEDFGVPLPGETILIAAAVYAGAGKLNIYAVIAIGFVAAVIGDNIGYLIGSYGGRRVVERYGKYVFITPERYEKAERFFQKRGGGIVIVARFIEGLRQLNGIIAGTSSMPWHRFVIFNAIGAALWVGCWASVGYFAGDNIDVIYHQINEYSLYVLIGIVVVAAAFLTRAVLRRRHR
jgi:membrane protein DedA with SNARE-associated domain